ncbi:uncharacterized protein [Montipora capricornis]|uniref:uncharacterized protein n=1 Tax=Montipora foliosa TaxID=591990 RepID=UPI0035F177AC
MSFKFNKKAVVTGLSSTEADKILVYAQTIKRISSQNSFSVDRNIFCVDVGAAALKKQSKTECKWLPEEVEKARIIPGTIITVNGKERYVKTEEEVIDHFKLLSPQAYQLFCPAFGSSSDENLSASAYPSAKIDQARRLCCAERPNPSLRWVMCKNVSLFYNKSSGRVETTVTAMDVVHMQQCGRLVTTSVQQSVTAQLNCKMCLPKVNAQNPGPVIFSQGLALVKMVENDVPSPRPSLSWGEIETLILC